MNWLIATSLLWAVSFGLIKGRLTGLDPDFVATVRLAISALVFLPFLKIRGVRPAIMFRLALIGSIQFGAMYVLYIRSYQYLAAHEVALFTVLTPMWVIWFEQRGRHLRTFAAAAIACVGAGVVQWSPLASEEVFQGFLLVQFANLCFAWGQFDYRRISPWLEQYDPLAVFGYCYVGAVVMAAAWLFGQMEEMPLAPTGEEWLTLLYLGLLPSGLGFFMWNRGATQVTAGTLAVMNDLKVPLAVIASLLFFGESAEPLPLLAGSAILAGALWLARSRSSASDATSASA